MDYYHHLYVGELDDTIVSLFIHCSLKIWKPAILAGGLVVEEG